MTIFLNGVLLFLILFYVYPLRFLFGALFGPPWMTPIAGLIYFFIGPVMWWHWSRFSKRWQDAA